MNFYMQQTCEYDKATGCIFSSYRWECTSNMQGLRQGCQS